MRGLTRRLDQISQFAMETTRKGTSNYWREMVDTKDKDKKGNSKLSTTERLFNAEHGNAGFNALSYVTNHRIWGATEGM